MTTATVPQTLIPAGTWAIDPAGSTVAFAVRHVGVATVRGAFRAFEGVLEIGAGDAEAGARGAVRVASIDTGDRRRDEHLCSGGFFDAERHPEIAFASTRIEAIDAATYWIVGDLTVCGVTEETVLTAAVVGVGTDSDGVERAGLTVTGEISRDLFGLRFRRGMRGGNAVVADAVRLTLDLTAVRRP